MSQTPPSDWYTWGEFCDAVRELMPLEKDRIGLQDDGDVDGYLTRNIRLAVIDLQNYILTYRKNHETIYYPQDFVTEGACSRAVAPPHAHLREFWLINNQADDAGNFRYPVASVPYSKRFELINQASTLALLPDQQGRIAMDDSGYTFYIYPKVADGWALSMMWDGIGVGNVKLDFKADEQVPFEEDCADAVADYVKAKVAREVDRDLAMAANYNTSYLKKRQDLYLRHKDKTRQL